MYMNATYMYNSHPGSSGSRSSSKGAIYIMFHIFSGNFRQFLRIVD